MRVLLWSALLVCLAVSAACRGSSPTPTVPPILSPTSAPTPTVTSESIATLVPTVGSTSTSTAIPSEIVTTVPDSEDPTGPALLLPVSISIRSSLAVVQPGQELTADVMVDPQGRGISGVQLTIEYDPAALQAVSIKPGPLLTGLSGQKAVEAGPNIDATQGRLEYAAARIGKTVPPTPPDRFATITIHVLDTAAPGVTTLKITAVKIPDENINEISDLEIGEGLRIQISP